MGISEMRATAEAVAKIDRLMNQLAHARNELKLVNAHGKAGTFWDAQVTLKRGSGGYHDQDVSVIVRIPLGVVQQQAVYKVAALEREIISLGGSVEKL